jgi:two-component system chemotaxis response regulator CheY
MQDDRMRVMLVDDDARMRQVLGRLLQTAGFSNVEEVSDGQEALDRLREIRVDLIITDCHMPRVDGIALVTALRAAGDKTPVIMLSGEHEPALIVRAVKAGVNNYIPKPIHPATFFEKIWQTLGVAPAAAAM